MAPERVAALLYQLPGGEAPRRKPSGLEAGNSPDIIFERYRELVTKEAAEEWFAIIPPEDWDPPLRKRRRRRKKKGR